MSLVAKHHKPSSSAFPASFFTGPLGTRNVVPNDPSGLLLGISTGNDFNPLGAAGQRTLVLQRCTDMAAAGRYTPSGAQVAGAPDVVGMSGIDQFTDGGVNSEAWVHNTVGAIPYLSWNASSGSTLAQVAAGAKDTEVDTIATRLKALAPTRIIFRMFHEFDNSAFVWYSPTGAAGYSTDDFIAAWRHIVNRITGSPNFVTNAGFYWCPTEQGNTTIRTTIRNSYPGDTYVDWIGSDIYNNASATDSAPGVPGWAEFSDLVDYNTFAGAMAHEWGGRKPFVIGETGCQYAVSGFPPPGGVVATGKANWYRNIISVTKASLGSKLLGVMHFDEDVTTVGNDWRVDSNAAWNQTTGTQDATTYTGFKDMAVTAQSQVGAVGGAT